MSAPTTPSASQAPSATATSSEISPSTPLAAPVSSAIDRQMVQRELLRGALGHDHPHLRAIDGNPIIVVTIQPSTTSSGASNAPLPIASELSPQRPSSHTFMQPAAPAPDGPDSNSTQETRGAKSDPRITRELEKTSNDHKETDSRGSSTESSRHDSRETKSEGIKSHTDRRADTAGQDSPEARITPPSVERTIDATSKETKPREIENSKIVDGHLSGSKLDTGATPPSIPSSPASTGQNPGADTPRNEVPRNEVPRNDPAQREQLLSQIEANIRYNFTLNQAISTAESNPSLGITPTTQISSLHQTSTELRTSVLEKLSQLQDSLDIAMARAAQPGHSDERGSLFEPQTKPDQGSFIYFDKPSRVETSNGATPELTLGPQRADRTTPNLASEARNDVAIAGGLQESRQTSAHRLLENLAGLAERALSLETLKKFDHALESACLSIFGVAALGVIATDKTLRTLVALGRYTNTLIAEKEEVPREEAPLLEGVSEALCALEIELLDKKSEDSATLVADITGVVGLATAPQPVEGVRVDGGILGSTHTDRWGQFALRNIPLGESFTLSFSHPDFNLHPGAVSGIVGLSTFINVAAER